MKVRNGFVSNSSSSSFLLNSKYLKETFGESWEDKIIHKFTLLAEVYNEWRTVDQMMTISTNTEKIKKLAKDYSYKLNKDDEECDIAIDSINDNSIPWPIQEYIEDELSGRRFHWG